MKTLTFFLLVHLCILIVSCNNTPQKAKEIANEDVPEIVKLITDKDNVSLKEMIKGYNVNTFDSSGVNLLTYAVMTGDLNIVKIVGDNGANPNLKNKTSMGSTPLMMSSEYTDLKIAKYLIEKGADINIQDNNGDPVINWSAYYGNVPFTKLMLDLGAKTDLKSIHSDCVMQVALKEWQDSVVDLLLKNGVKLEEVEKESVELINAIKTNNVELAKSLLNKNNKNARDAASNTLLIIAANKGYAEIVELLLSVGANIDAMNSVGQTALNKAVYSKKNSIAKLLINHGADVNKVDTFFRLSPLTAAIRSNNLEMGKILLGKGAEINTADGINNFTPIMWATLYQNKNFVSLLLEYNPDLSVVSKYETTVFDMTQDKELLKLLKWK